MHRSPYPLSALPFASLPEHTSRHSHVAQGRHSYKVLSEEAMQCSVSCSSLASGMIPGRLPNLSKAWFLHQHLGTIQPPSCRQNVHLSRFFILGGEEGISEDFCIQQNCELGKLKTLPLKARKYAVYKKKKRPLLCMSNGVYSKRKSPGAKNQEATANRTTGHEPSYKG